MKKAVIYARFSCSNQTEQSIEGQLRVCYDYAKKNNIVVIDGSNRFRDGEMNFIANSIKLLEEEENDA